MPIKLISFASFHKSSPGPLVIRPKESHDLFGISVKHYKIMIQLLKSITLNSGYLAILL